MGDAARLRQIVFNLLSNAVKFTAAGHVTLAVVPGERRFTVTVADTGIGIAPDAHEVIFESFRQADAGTTRQFGGTGLGLSICRNLSRAMDGDVTVASTLGHGAVFTLDLPLIPAAPSEEASSELALLLVERNPINRAMFKSLFAAHGEIAFAAHLDEAVAVLARQRPRWVLADEATVQACGEPDGVLGRIVQAAGEAPVALLAAAMAADMRVRLLGAGVADVIERPIGKKALVERVLALGSALVREAA